jgi:AcrR family transcriptional regulator
MGKADSAADARPYHHGDLRHVLIEAALALVAEEQDWTFSLREVARRAGVSHNAPYNHFGGKQDLLVAVAAAGFESLRDRMRGAISAIDAADAALRACGRAYIKFAMQNPALYRLMFGPALAKTKGGRPPAARFAGADAKTVLAEIILRGARSGVFAVSPDDRPGQEMAVFFSWSAIHGVTMLLLDDFMEADFALDDAIKGFERTLLTGLTPR